MKQKKEKRQPTLKELEKIYILKILEQCGGKQKDTAKILGIGRTTLWRKLIEYGVIPPIKKRRINMSK